jgi:hypothetical protein
MYISDAPSDYRSVHFTKNSDLLPEDQLIAPDPSNVPPMGDHLKIVFAYPGTEKVSYRVREKGGWSEPMDTDRNLFALGYKASRKPLYATEPPAPGVDVQIGPEAAFREYGQMQRRLDALVDRIEDPFESRNMFEALRLLARRFRDIKDMYYSGTINPAETESRVKVLVAEGQSAIAKAKLVAEGR